MTRTSLQHRAGPVACPFCHDQIRRDLWRCPDCGTPHHGACVRENGRCTIFGCGAPSPRLAVVAPVASAPAVVVATIPLRFLPSWSEYLGEMLREGGAALLVGSAIIAPVVYLAVAMLAVCSEAMYSGKLAIAGCIVASYLHAFASRWAAERISGHEWLR